MKRVLVLGATGFVGRHVVGALSMRGAEVVAVPAPRVRTRARSLEELRDELETSDIQAVVSELRLRLARSDVVVNAAGVADATGSGDVLFGADALLPGLVARAAPPAARVVHVSSSAVQGRRPMLDETEEYAPFSDYSTAKMLGEQLAREERSSVVIFRPTSVQGPERRVTRQLARIASSPLSCVAGGNPRATPQVLAENVADAIAYVALTPDVPPPVVLQPWEGLTTTSLLTSLGARSPLHIPNVIARLVLGVLFLVGSRRSKVAGIARRVEMLWFGQDQEPGWLTGRWTAPLGTERWKEIA